MVGRLAGGWGLGSALNCGWFNRQRYARRPRPVALNALGGKYGMGQGLVMTLTMGVKRFGVGVDGDAKVHGVEGVCRFGRLKC